MPKLTLKTLVFIVFATIIQSVSFAQTTSQTTESIDNFSAIVSVNKSGSLTVTENIDYNFGSLQRHGIFRFLPNYISDSLGRQYKVTVKNVNIKNNSYSVTNTGNNTVIKIGSASKFVTGKVNYQISYEVLGGIRYFDNYDEIYWNSVGTDWQIPIKKVKIQVIVPNEITLNTNEIKCFTGLKNSRATECAINLTAPNQFFVTVNRALNPGEGVTFAASFPKDIVAVVIPESVETKNNYKAGPVLSYLYTTPVLMVRIFLGALLFIVVLPGILIYYATRDYFNTKKNAKITSAWFEPPKRADGSNLSPAEVYMLVNKKLDHKALSAEIIDLAEKGYLKISIDPKTKEISFIKRRDFKTGTDLKDFEIDVLDSLFDQGNKSLTKQKELKTSENFYKEYNSFVTKVSASLFKEKLFEKDIEKSANNFSGLMVVIMIVLFFTTNFIFGIFLIFLLPLINRHIAMKTMLGIEKYSEAVSLRNFLQSQEDQLNFQAKNQYLFEKLLPYATAFGVEEVWAKRFADLQMTKTDWYDGDLTYSTAHIRTFSALSRNMNSSVTYARTYSSSRSFSSGSHGSFGGGFSGGGGGGGGGGSW